jgi:hypothetical protein
MRPSLILSVLLLALCGCTAPVLQIPIGQAAVLYGDWKYLQGTLTVSLTVMCRDKQLTEAQCNWLKAESEKAIMVDKDIRKSLIDAKGEIDKEKVMEYLQILAGIAVKMGGL